MPLALGAGTGSEPRNTKPPAAQLRVCKPAFDCAGLCMSYTAPFHSAGASCSTCIGSFVTRHVSSTQSQPHTLPPPAPRTSSSKQRITKPTSAKGSLSARGATAHHVPAPAVLRGCRSARDTAHGTWELPFCVDDLDSLHEASGV